jgi:hypothetical protein
VVVEDAHWADEATLDLLVFLARRMHGTRALLMVTYRDDELGVDHPLRAAVARLPPEAVRLVTVVPGRAELWLLEQASGPPATAVEVGVAAGLLVIGARCSWASRPASRRRWP